MRQQGDLPDKQGTDEERAAGERGRGEGSVSDANRTRLTCCPKARPLSRTLRTTRPHTCTRTEACGALLCPVSFDLAARCDHLIIGRKVPDLRVRYPRPCAGPPGAYPSRSAVSLWDSSVICFEDRGIHLLSRSSARAMPRPEFAPGRVCTRPLRCSTLRVPAKCHDVCLFFS